MARDSTDPTPSTEALCEAALARIRQVEPHDEWSAPVLALAARARELEAEREGWERQAYLATGSLTTTREAHAAEVAALRAEVARLTERHENLQALKLGEQLDAARAEHHALRARLAESEAGLVGLRAAVSEARKNLHSHRADRSIVSARGGVEAAVRDLDTALADSRALGARVIEEAERRGRDAERLAKAAHDADTARAFLAHDAAIEAAREEAYGRGWKDRHMGRAVEVDLLRKATAERDEAAASLSAALARLAEIEAAALAVLEKREDAEKWRQNHVGRSYVEPDDVVALRTALASTPPAALDRVRRAVLEEAKAAALAAYREHEPGGLFIDFATRLDANLAARGGA